MGKKIVIVAGGSIDADWARKYIEEAELTIAADRGVECFMKLNLKPDYIIGDFDSASDLAKKAVAIWNIPVTTLPTHKDDTDSEAALSLCWEQLIPELADKQISIEEIDLIGGTGTRIDHVLGNISIIGQGLSRKIPVYLMDVHNRIRLCDASHPVKLPAVDQYGKYISVVPMTTDAKGVNLEGMVYPLSNFHMQGYNSLGISNEIDPANVPLGESEPMAKISVEEGVLIIIESRD